MMIAPTVRNLIRSNSTSLGLDPKLVFAYSISKKVNADKLDKIVILISEMDDNPAASGSNSTILKEGRIQIQIFYPADYDNPTDNLRDQLLTLLEVNDWYCYFDGGIERDPQTQQLFNTSHYTKLYERSVH